MFRPIYFRSLHTASYPYALPVSNGKKKDDESLKIQQYTGGKIGNMPSEKMTLSTAIQSLREEKKKPINKKIINVKEAKFIEGVKPSKKKKKNAEVILEQRPEKEEKKEEEPRKKLKPAEALMRLVAKQLNTERKKVIEKKVRGNTMEIQDIQMYMENVCKALELDVSQMKMPDLEMIKEKWGSSIPRLAKSLLLFLIMLVRKQKRVKINVSPFIMRTLIRNMEDVMTKYLQGSEITQEHYEKVRDGLQSGIKGRLATTQPNPIEDVYSQPQVLEYPQNQFGTTNPHP
jgi:hypothetical protein